MQLSTTNIYDLLDLLEYVEKYLPVRYGGVGLAWGDQPHQKVVLASEKVVESGDIALYLPKELISLDEVAYRRGYYSPPLTWEPCPGGLLSALAKSMALEELVPFPPLVKFPNFKLAIYVPVRCVNVVLDVLVKMGAGSVGRYSGCSFLAQGLGRFKPLSGANPIFGEIGQWETIEEVMLLTQAEIAVLGWASAAAVLVHPYDEVVVDIWELTGQEETYGTALMGTWTHKADAKRGPEPGERVVLAHSETEIQEKDIKDKGVRWVIVPGEKMKASARDGYSIWEIPEEKFYHPGLKQWQELIKELCQLVKTPI